MLLQTDGKGHDIQSATAMHHKDEARKILLLAEMAEMADPCRYLQKLLKAASLAVEEAVLEREYVFRYLQIPDKTPFSGLENHCSLTTVALKAHDLC